VAGSLLTIPPASSHCFPKITSNRICSALTDCLDLDNAWSSVLPTLTSNVVCAHAVSSCNLTAPWVLHPPTFTSDRVCVEQCPHAATRAPSSPPLAPGTACTVYCDGYESPSSPVGTAPSCVQHCAADQYVVPAQTNRTSRGVCTDVSNCSVGAPYQMRAPTITTDRVCAARCTAAEYGAPPKTPGTAFKVCAALTNCTERLESVPPTLTTDRQCSSGCRPWQYADLSAADSHVAAGVCTNVTNCAVGVNYQSKAPTLTSNRQCSFEVTAQCLNGTHESEAPTLTSNRVCVKDGTPTPQAATVSSTGTPTPAPTLTPSTSPTMPPGCPNDMFACRNNHECIQTRLVCDSVYDCTDHSDEAECTAAPTAPLASRTSRGGPSSSYAIPLAIVAGCVVLVGGAMWRRQLLKHMQPDWTSVPPTINAAYEEGVSDT
jgi:hypothetical protein